MLTGVYEQCLVGCVFTHVWGVFHLSHPTGDQTGRNMRPISIFCLWLDGDPVHVITW